MGLYKVIMLREVFIVRRVVVSARLAVARSSTLPFAFIFEEDVRILLLIL